MSAIYTKRFSTVGNGLCIVEFKGNAVRILQKDGKRRDFATFGEASRIIWHINNANSKFQWSAWMTKASFNASVQARLAREANNGMSEYLDNSEDDQNTDQKELF